MMQTADVSTSIVERARRIHKTREASEFEIRQEPCRNGLYLQRSQGQVPLSREKPGSYVRKLPKQALVVSPSYYRRIAGRVLTYAVVAAGLIVLILVLRKAGLFSF